MKSQNCTQKVFICLLGVAGTCVIISYYLELPLYLGVGSYQSPEFSVSVIDRTYFEKNCFDGISPQDMEQAFAAIETWSTTTIKRNAICRKFYDLFTLIYDISDRYSNKINIPPVFFQRIKKMMNYNQSLIDSVQHQHLLFVMNKWTFEDVLYNPVRAQRPLPQSDMNINKWIDDIANSSRKSCDFCNYSDMTAVDELGRNNNSLTVRITNTFKLEAWHSMVISKTHHPTNISEEVLVAMFQDATRWAMEVHHKDHKYVFPDFVWDTLPKAGVSQIHPHLHMMMSPHRYFGGMEQLRMMSDLFLKKTSYNYFNTLIQIHEALGLTVKYGEAVALSPLTGRTDLEVMILSPTPSNDLYTLFYHVRETYHNNFKQFCHSVGAAWPDFTNSSYKIPAIIRITSRGDCASTRSDISSLELLEIVYRDHNPWMIIKSLKSNIEKVINHSSKP